MWRVRANAPAPKIQWDEAHQLLELGARAHEAAEAIQIGNNNNKCCAKGTIKSPTASRWLTLAKV